MQVTQADAAAVKSAIVTAAGAPSRGVIRHLDAVVSAVRTGGVKVIVHLELHVQSSSCACLCHVMTLP